jgi:hypothetical protein
MHTNNINNLKQYDVVKIISFSNPDSINKSEFDIKKPEIGDIATIIEIYTNPTIGYELECSDSKTGETLWLCTFDLVEIKLELLH